jgi:hypothetical protein
MKYNIFWAVFCGLIFSQSCDRINKNYTSMKISYVDNEILTNTRVSCDRFETSFINIVVDTVITNVEIINNVRLKLKKLQKIKLDDDLDVRTKIIFNTA